MDFHTLYDELKSKDFPIDDYESNLSFLQETHFLLHPHQHEGKVITYGFVSVTDSPSSGFQVVTPSEIPITSARDYADGKNIFLLLVNNKYHGLLITEKLVATEGDLIAFQKLTGGIVGVLNPLGISRLIYHGNIAIHELRNWTFKLSVSRSVEQVKSYIPTINELHLVELLKYCFYTLSAQKVGTTIVWFITDNQSQALKTIQNQKNIKPIGINIFNSKNTSALLSLLERNDGATIMLSNGDIPVIGAHLVVSEDSTNLLSSYSGTRHTSARRFSYDWPECIVVTVSADGPVSIFSDGLKITQLQINTIAKEAGNLRSINPDYPEKVESSSYEVRCGKCGKYSIVHEILVYGWREPESTSCQVCDEKLVAKRTFLLNSQLIKKLPT
jgi:DNA integrity scanning protein DisA with diadenylate cyclase activity